MTSAPVDAYARGMTSVPNVSLCTGTTTIDIPQLGFGVWQVPDAEVTDAVATALEVGYRSIDTAAAYQNEDGVGRALARTDVPREEIFLTTKVWNDEHGYESTLRAFDASAKRLGQEVVDLYLIHWPVPSKDAYVDTWRALLELRSQGRIRAAGVCNFQPAHLQRLLDETGELPALNQIELHPRLQQAELRAWHADHEVVTEAWSPLAQGDLLEDGTIETVAAHHERTPAQVILRWHLQLGNVVIPKSATSSRIRENFELFDFALSEDDMAAIERLDAGERTGPDPATFSVA
jgi:2,5-diketo-D-gluconate reductase A